MRLALFQPDIPGNVGAILRTCACLGVPADLIEPLGFAWDDKRVRRAGMDYFDHVAITRHQDWPSFRSATPGRLVLLTSRGSVPVTDVTFETDDVILMGSESAGAPPHVHDAADLRVDRYARTVTIEGRHRYLADQHQIRLRGANLPEALATDDAETAIDFEWITHHVAAQALGYRLEHAYDRKEAEGRLLQLQQRADAVRGTPSESK